jgi:NADH-quinone oxidoreductase subunit L
MTAFYMTREVILVFFGKARWGESAEAELANLRAHGVGGGATSLAVRSNRSVDGADHAEGGDPGDDAVAADEPHPAEVHPHESVWMMTVPLVVLAFFAAIAGVLNLPFTEDMEFLNRWLEPVIGQYQAHLESSTLQTIIELAISTVVAVSGIAIAYAVYVKHKFPARRIELPFLYHGWYIDHGVTVFMGGPGRRLFDLVALFDRVVIDGAVNGVGRLTRGGASHLRSIQNGFVRWYALMIGLGAVLILAYLLTQVNF